MSSILNAFEQLWRLDDLMGGGEEDDEEDVDFLYDINYLIDPEDYVFHSDDMSTLEMTSLLHQLGFDSSDHRSDEE